MRREESVESYPHSGFMPMRLETGARVIHCVIGLELNLSTQKVGFCDYEVINLCVVDTVFQGVKELSVCGFGLKYLPKSIEILTSLTTLDISFNELTMLPDSIGNLTSLVELDVSDNRLSSLPKSVSRMPKLAYLFVTGNALASTNKQKNLFMKRFSRAGLLIRI